MNERLTKLVKKTEFEDWIKLGKELKELEKRLMDQTFYNVPKSIWAKRIFRIRKNFNQLTFDLEARMFKEWPNKTAVYNPNGKINKNALNIFYGEDYEKGDEINARL